MESIRVYEYGYDNKKEGGIRTPYQIDRDRIIHSSAFRRLRNKTQVFGVFTLDYYRTRLTHSLEVSQIARSIASNMNKKYGLNIDIDLIEAISLAHDIGHPPFGHVGESIINEKLKGITDGECGFEANAQNIRILNFLEKKFYDKDNNKIYGLNPSLKTIDGILKYKLPYYLSDKSKHFIYDGDIFILERLHGKSFIEFIEKNFHYINKHENKNIKEEFFEASRCLECQILNAADDIAYATHDLEDGVESKLIDATGRLKVKRYVKEGRFLAGDLAGIESGIDKFFNGLKDIFGSFNDNGRAAQTERSGTRRSPHHAGDNIYPAMCRIKIKTDLKEFFSRYISKFILNIDIEDREKYIGRGKNDLIKKIPLDFKNDSYKYNLIWKNEVNVEIKALKQISYRLVMENKDILLNRYKVKNIIEKLFCVFSDKNNLKLYPDDFQELYENGFYDGFGKNGFYVMCGDYISGMTDIYAVKLYSALFEAKSFPGISSSIES